MVKKYLLIFVLLAAIFSCKSPATRNVEGEPAVYTQSYVDRHFPSWDVGIAAFEIEDDTVTISLAERKYIVELLALLRVLVNTPEFEERVMNLAWAHNQTMYPYTTAQVPGGQWNITDPKQKLVKYRVLHTVKRIGYDLWVQKKASKVYMQHGSNADMAYAYMDVDNNYKIGRKVWLYNRDWTNWPAGLQSILRDFFHETMHNLGYLHAGGNVTGVLRQDSVPYVYGEEMMALFNTGEVMAKYATQIEKMKAFYLNKYKSVIEAEPLSVGGGFGDYRIGPPRRTH